MVTLRFTEVLIYLVFKVVQWLKTDAETSECRKLSSGHIVKKLSRLSQPLVTLQQFKEQHIAHHSVLSTADTVCCS